MNLYLVSQDINDGYDTYDSMIVSAESEIDARNIHPDSCYEYSIFRGNPPECLEFWGGVWVNYEDIDQLEVNFIGVSNVSRGVVLASYNKG